MTEPTNLAAALAAAQAEMDAPVKDSVNPHYKSKFASLASVRAATLPALNRHGLSISHVTGYVEGRFGVIGKLRHVGGESDTSFWPITEGKPQEMGSALSYGTRYTWQALCGVAAMDDDDGNAAQAAPVQEPRADDQTLKALWNLALRKYPHDEAQGALADLCREVAGKDSPRDLTVTEANEVGERLATITDREPEGAVT